MMAAYGLALVYVQGVEQLAVLPIAGGVPADDHGPDLSVPGVALLAR